VRWLNELIATERAAQDEAEPADQEDERRSRNE
jgi:hypothetical protein